MRSKFLLLWVCLLAGLIDIAAQEKLSKQEFSQRIKEARYTEVYSSLELNYQKYPRDPDYVFWLGVCKVELNYDIPQAVNLLNEAIQQDIHKESWFYLGRANMLNYQFATAGEVFNRFGEKAGREEKEKVRFTLYQSMCRNAIDICGRSKKLSVIRIDTVPEKELLSYLNRQQIGGKLEKMGEGDKLPKKEGIKFSGNNLVAHTKYPFGKKYKDIFVSESDDIEIDKSKTIGSAVNTSNDEEFVYYDETVPALYFSSQGHNSAGGYDIFKSYYDKVTRKWSKPVNMGFPINTPADEIAYVNIPGTKRSVLASKRNAAPGKVVVYTLESAEEASEEQIASVQALELSKLKPGKQKAFPVTNNKPAEKKAVAYKKNEVPAEIRDEKSYQKLIHDALSMQIRSDSVRRVSDQKKELLVSAKTENEKKKLWQEIRVLDTRADEIQQKADVLYKKARQIEADKQGYASHNSQELAQKAFKGKTNSVGDGNEKAGGIVNQNPTEPIYDIQYRIQVGVFSKPQPEDMFKGFGNIYKEDLRDGAAFKYYVGLFRKIAEAEKGLIKVKDAGFKDAFIIGFYNGKIVPLSRARELEMSGKRL